MKYRTNPSLAGALRHLSAPEDVIAFQRRTRPLQYAGRRRGGFANHPEPETTCMRMAIACASPEDLTVLMGRLEVDLYYVAVRLETRSGVVRCSWVVDDERRPGWVFHGGSPHPVPRMAELFFRARDIDLATFEALESGRENPPGIGPGDSCPNDDGRDGMGDGEESA